MPHPEQVIRTGQIKMLQSRREYRCVKCEHRFTLTADLEQRHQMPLPDECPSNNAKPCRGSKFEFVEGTEVCKDYQEVRIQEQVRAPALVDSARASGRDASREWLARAESGASSSPAHSSGALVRRTCQVHRLLVGSIPRSITLLLQDNSSPPSGGRHDSRSRVDGR